VVDAWRTSQGQLETIRLLTLSEVSHQQHSNEKVVLDVRGKEEWRAGHLAESLNIPLAELDQRAGEIPRNRTVIVHCQTGARAAMATSLLRATGFDDVRLFSGGFAEWQAAGLPVET
jgi:hydroxyacylglutathione hydrolase